MVRPSDSITAQSESLVKGLTATLRELFADDSENSANSSDSERDSPLIVIRLIGTIVGNVAFDTHESII
jgi:hypothetical protein